MAYDPEKHHRRSIRLRGYDYAQLGAYFVTLCAQGRECLFGEVVDGQMHANEYGEIAEYTWRDLVNHSAGIELDVFVIMPNHVHGILFWHDPAGVGSVGAGSEPAPTATVNHNAGKRHGLPEIIRQFKTFSGRRINECRHTPGVQVWQRNYYEHIIRNDQSLNRIRQYILDNPARWAMDRENPQAQKGETEDAWRL